MDQRAARVVADATKDGCADAGGANDGVGVAAERLQGILKLVEGGAGEADNLAALLEQMNFGKAERIDDDDRTVVVLAVGCRTTGQPRIRSLHDDDCFSGGASVQNAPHLDK
jgi:hypothetical protein